MIVISIFKTRYGSSIPVFLGSVPLFWKISKIIGLEQRLQIKKAFITKPTNPLPVYDLSTVVKFFHGHLLSLHLLSRRPSNASFEIETEHKLRSFSKYLLIVDSQRGDIEKLFSLANDLIDMLNDGKNVDKLTHSLEDAKSLRSSCETNVHETIPIIGRDTLSMCASVLGIIPDHTNKTKISGFIVERSKKKVEKFEFDPAMPPFEACDRLWKMSSR